MYWIEFALYNNFELWYNLLTLKVPASAEIGAIWEFITASTNYAKYIYFNTFSHFQYNCDHHMAFFLGAQPPDFFL